MKNESPFISGDVIYTYTDAQAIEDGLLVAVNPRDRVTRAVWEFLVEKQPTDSKPPNCWPVGMMGWFRAAAISKTEAAKLIAKHGKDEGQRVYARLVADRKAHALAIGVIDSERDKAKRVYEHNIGGGIHCQYARLADGIIKELADEKTGTSLWLIPNENGGITLMFPEDY